MRPTTRRLSIIVGAAGVVGAGIALGWWGTLGSRNSDAGPSEMSPARESSAVLPTAESQVTSASAGPSSEGVVQTTNDTAGADPAWEERMMEILASNQDDTNKAAQLLELFPRVPEAGQVEVVQTLAPLVADEDYAALAQMMQNTNLPAPVLDALMVDLLDRPQSIKLPLLVELMRDSDHPKTAEAKDTLRIYFEEDYGTNWGVWHQKVLEWLDKNPDVPANRRFN
jgi:hypothetical protein